MRRGDLITIAVSGDYGKPRPAMIIQADAFFELASVTVLRLTSELRDAPALRIRVEPDAQNGLRAVSQIMIDKATTAPRDRVGPVFGRVDDKTMEKVDRALAAFLGLPVSASGSRSY